MSQGFSPGGGQDLLCEVFAGGLTAPLGCDALTDMTPRGLISVVALTPEQSRLTCDWRRMVPQPPHPAKQVSNIFRARREGFGGSDPVENAEQGWLQSLILPTRTHGAAERCCSDHCYGDPRLHL